MADFTEYARLLVLTVPLINEILSGDIVLFFPYLY